MPTFPLINLLDGRRIALHGAGHIGRSYQRQIKKWNICNISICIDWEKYARAGSPVESMESLMEVDYDFIILATVDWVAADTASRELVSIGIEDSLILWKEPLDIT